MIRQCLLRSSLLALVMLLGGATSVLAHALPGSVLLLRQDGAELQITIQFPLEDLVIAAPELAALEEAKADAPLPKEMTERLASYLGRHFSLTEGGTPLPLTLSDARIQPAYHDHLGHFMLVVSQWDAASTGTDPGSFVLKYDAVMHEVRNHRATVRLLSQNSDARPIAEFGFFDAGKGIPLDLSATGLE
jgi:hypothetical protein